MFASVGYQNNQGEEYIAKRIPRSNGSWADLQDADDSEPGPIALWGSRSNSSLGAHSGSESGSGTNGKKLPKKLGNMRIRKDQVSVSSEECSQSLSLNSKRSVQGRQLAIGSPSYSPRSSSGYSEYTEETSQSCTILSTAESSDNSRGADQLEKNLEGLPVSLGSARHDLGVCKPCLFVHTNVGCQNGALCEFCHFVHKRKSKPRPCKGKRDRYRKLLMRMEQNSPDGQGGPQDEDDEDGEAIEDGSDSASLATDSAASSSLRANVIGI